VTALDALERARAAWEATQPQLILFEAGSPAGGEGHVRSGTPRVPHSQIRGSDQTAGGLDPLPVAPLSGASRLRVTRGHTRSTPDDRAAQEASV
jgi:hypothetical protein